LFPMYTAIYILLVCSHVNDVLRFCIITNRKFNLRVAA
jgi:hypothetical protein